MIKIYLVNDEEDEAPPPAGPTHWIPIGDWAPHVPETYCPCKPDYDQAFDEYTHRALDGRVEYEKKGWLLD